MQPPAAAAHAKAQWQEARTRFIEQQSLYVPLASPSQQLILVQKEPESGYVNVTHILRDAGVPCSAKQMRATLTTWCTSHEKTVESVSRVMKNAKEARCLWIDAPVAYQVLKLLGCVFDHSAWATRRLFCANNDFWYIEDPLPVQQQPLRAVSPNLLQQMFPVYLKSTQSKADAMLDAFCAVFAQCHAALENVPLSAFTEAFLAQLLITFRSSGLFLESSTPAATPAPSQPPVEESKSHIPQWDVRDMDWTFPDLESAIQLYQPSDVERHARLYSEEMDAKMRGKKALDEFYESHQVEWYDVKTQHSIWNHLNANNRAALRIVDLFRLVLRVFRDRFVLQHFDECLAYRPVSGDTIQRCPSGVIGRCTPQMPMPVLFEILRRVCRDNPRFPHLPVLSDEDRHLNAVMSAAAFYLSVSPDDSHSLISCESLPMDATPKPTGYRKHLQHFAWPKEAVEYRGRMLEPRVFKCEHIVRNLCLRLDFVPWSYVLQQKPLNEWFGQQSDGLPNAPAAARRTSKPSSKATALSSSLTPQAVFEQRSQAVLDHIKRDYPMRKVWIWPVQPLIDSKYIGMFYVPLISSLLELLAEMKIHVTPVDISDVSVYIPLDVALNTLSQFSPAIRVLLRFLTAEQALRLFTALGWLRKPELTERMYPRYGVRSLLDARVNLFIADHDLIASFTK